VSRVAFFETRLTVLFVGVLLAIGVTGRVGAQQPQTGSARGTVADTSGGVLPGVTVSAADADGRTLSFTVTDGTGAFAFDHLPAGPINLLFHLDGFEDAKATVTVAPADADAARRAATIAQQLQIKSLAETVTVRADLPPPPPPPRPVLQPVPEHDPSAVCGPAKAEGIVQSPGTVRSRRDEVAQKLFGGDEELLIDGGAITGMRVGQNYIVRRRYPTALVDRKGKVVMGEHSSGLVQIVSVDDEVATAVVVYACDEMMSGDYLVRFDAEPPIPPDPMGPPSFDSAARILFADAGQSLGATNRMLVIDRGARDGVRPGQRFTLFRRSRFGHTKPVVVGQAVVVTARRESATVRVEQATDVVFFGEDGDWAAPQGPMQRAAGD
jgi:hypothetical protein